MGNLLPQGEFDNELCTHSSFTLDTNITTLGLNKTFCDAKTTPQSAHMLRTDPSFETIKDAAMKPFRNTAALIFNDQNDGTVSVISCRNLNRCSGSVFAGVG